MKREHFDFSATKTTYFKHLADTRLSSHL